MSVLKRYKVREVPIGRVRAPGDLRERMASGGVVELAESIQKHGMIYPIVVEKSTGHIIAGRDRYSANYLLGGDKATIRVEYVDTESQLHARQLELVENLHRRQATGQQRREMLKELFAVYEAEAAAVKHPENVPRKRGRPRTPRGEAIRKLSKVTGTSLSTLERELRRDAQRKAGTERDQAKAAAEPPVETFGLEIDAGYLVQLRAIQDVLDQGYSELMAWRRRLSRLDAEGSPVYSSAVQQLTEYAQRLQHLMKERRPHAICPACKMVETLTPDCMECAGHGYASQAAWAETPDALRNTEDLQVVYGASEGNARIVSYDSMFEPEEEDSKEDGPEDLVETLDEVRERLAKEVAADPESNVDLYEVEP